LKVDQEQVHRLEDASGVEDLSGLLLIGLLDEIDYFLAVGGEFNFFRNFELGEVRFQHFDVDVLVVSRNYLLQFPYDVIFLLLLLFKLVLFNTRQESAVTL
jgi:hypothetical protein